MFAVVYRPGMRVADAEDLRDDDVETAKFIGAISGDERHVFQHKDGEVIRLGTSNPPRRSVSEHESVAATVRNLCATEVVLHKMELGPGQYRPRIARPSDKDPLAMPERRPLSEPEQVELYASRRHFASLTGMLRDILSVVEPSIANFKCYGDQIRSLLLLTCTECENQMRGVLRANGLSGNGPCKDRYWTKDFVQLRQPMRLDEYEVKFWEFPQVGTFSPFLGWDPDKPSQSLPWYEAYNASKHDRLKDLHQANLEMVLQALAGLWVLLVGQYGIGELDRIPSQQSMMLPVSAPRWRYSEVYTGLYLEAPAGFEAVQLFA